MVVNLEGAAVQCGWPTDASQVNAGAVQHPSSPIHTLYLPHRIRVQHSHDKPLSSAALDSDLARSECHDSYFISETCMIYHRIDKYPAASQSKLPIKILLSPRATMCPPDI
jgi:hypothetical protein